MRVEQNMHCYHFVFTHFRFGKDRDLVPAQGGPVSFADLTGVIQITPTQAQSVAFGWHPSEKSASSRP